jgi:enoyl-CoA hydratase
MKKKSETDLLSGQWDLEKMCTDPEKLENAVLYETDPEKKVAWITFNVPEKLNAVPVAALERVGDLVREAEADENVKVIIFRGNGPCFGTGADADELGYYIGYKSGTSAGDKKRPSQRQRILPDRNIIFGAFERTIMECLKATICQVHGYCYGGHMQIALAADIVIASPDATFTHPAFRYLGPAPQDMFLWMENLGIKKMKEIMLTMRPLTAEEGLQCGLINKIVPREELEKWALDYAQAITLMPLDAIMMGKAMMQMMMEARGKGLGSMTAWVGHGWCTNLVYQPDEWSFLKERRNKGLSKTLHERDQMVAPFFRMGGRLGK